MLAAPAFAARPVARWDVIPDQRVSGIFRAGVCAFHEDGVSVEFRVNGDIAYVTEKPTLNPRTGVWEYVFPVNTALLPDGPVTLGARAFTLAASPEDDPRDFEVDFDLTGEGGAADAAPPPPRLLPFLDI